MRVLLVEDDAMIGRSLDKALSGAGMAVDWVQTGDDCRVASRDIDYNLLLLDLGLPDGSGLEALRALRKANVDVPVIIITARDDVPTRVAGLDSGADDYVVKPFSFEELNARIRAVLRRHKGRADTVIVAGELTLDPSRHQATYRGTTMVLPRKEFALLWALADRPGGILSKKQLEDQLYDWGNEVESNAVEVLIHYVRKKFDKDIVRNVRGIGWTIPAGVQ
jgi:DNA-binding response OmpR family regulator